MGFFKKLLGQETPSPKTVTDHYTHGIACLDQGDLDAAIVSFDEVIKLAPKYAEAWSHRGLAFKRKGDFVHALADYGEAIHLDPQADTNYDRSAWILATCPEGKHRNGQEALLLATQACEMTSWNDPELFETLAAAYAEVGRFPDAIKWQKQAIASAGFRDTHLEKARARLTLYEAKKPYRETD